MTEIRDIPLQTIKGGQGSLADYAGQVVLIVNVASQCGLTPQYEGLERLYEKYKEEGFVVLGFPANDFAGQEPGTNEEIASFCTTNFGVGFPMFSKIEVTGPNKHPLYRELTAAIPDAMNAEAMRARFAERGKTPNAGPEVLWNFEKFLLGRDGNVVGRFSPDTLPEDDAVITAVERELFASE